MASDGQNGIAPRPHQRVTRNKKIIRAHQMGMDILRILGTRASRAVGEPLPRLLLRQPHFGKGATVEEALTGRVAVVAEVEPAPGGIAARIIVKRRGDSKGRELSETEAWGGKWRLS